VKSKKIFDISFILITTTLLLLFAEYIPMERYIGFALIPLYIAYSFGQFVGRKTKQEAQNEIL